MGRGVRWAGVCQKLIIKVTVLAQWKLTRFARSVLASRISKPVGMRLGALLGRAMLG